MIEMKSKYILFLTILFVSCASQKKLSNNIRKQNYEYKALESFRGDTLNYVVSNFVEHKNQYIGKPASVLFNDLQYEIKSYLPFSEDAGETKTISISYLTDNQYTYKLSERQKMIVINITFETITTWDKVLELKAGNYEIGTWTPRHRAYFEKLIVKDINYYAIPNDEKK